MRKTRTHRAVLLAIGFVMTVFTVFPVYWMIVTAFRTPNAVLTSKSVLPGPFSLDGMATLFAITPFTTYLTNSIIVSVAVTVANLIIVTPVAYLISKMSGRLRGAVSFSVLLGYMFPEVLVVLPAYVILVNIGLDNTLVGLVLGILSIALPLGLWLLTAFMKSIPREVEEAALIDGASWLQLFWRIIVPLSKPGILTVGLFSFILAWADYVFALTIIRSEASKTLPVGLAALYGDLDASWNVIMSGAIMISLPVMVVVIVCSRYFVGGLTLGSTKG